ncbi:MAG: TIGR03936 family radical SAM-associated protein [Lachnospiraceae bacterium]|nr:TIGR03936 family radical SAM-associated protein [Lachnospiraceae bacterium]
MRIRIKFRKYGVMRFIGHLDIMRYFQKAMRRANIDIAYSEGFSPHQIMSFAAPLGVGITSDGEYLDIEVHSTKSTDESRDALNAVMVDGIEITEYVALRQDAKKAMTSVAAADYIVYFKNQIDFTQEELEEKIHQYYEERDTIEVTKQTKKSERVIDIKPLIYRFSPCNLEESGWQGFFLQLSTGSTDNIKPELVLQDFYQYFGKTYDPFNMQIHRVETYERTEEGLRPLYQAGDNIES